MHVVVEAVAFLVIIGSADYLDREHIQHGEYYALVLFATVGMGVMASAAELMTAFVGLETSSISTYILASYRRDSPRSNESAMKYFLLGSFATAFFLYGIALTYGATGTTQLGMMKLPTTPGGEHLLDLGLALMLVGLAFKVAAAPFQLWTPDVYEGAPAPVTALMSSGPKAAAFALLLRILATVAAAGTFWFWALWVSAVLTMFVGNLAALAQTNVKRMLAYSSIAHAGYILVALTAAAASDQVALGVAAVLYYLAVYALMKLGAFMFVSQLGGESERHMDIDDFRGLATRQPVAAACFALFLLSLLGLPVTAGFLGKFYIFNAALASHLVWLAVLLAINSVIGVVLLLARHRGDVHARAESDLAAGAHALGRDVRSLRRRRGHGLPRTIPRPRHGACDASRPLPAWTLTNSDANRRDGVASQTHAPLTLSSRHQMVSTVLDPRIARSAVSKGSPSTKAVAPMMRSAGSLG